MKKTDFMKTALRLAKKGLNKTGSNPMVGAVIVKNNKIIGKGFHEKFGGPHAEVNAINNAEERGFSVVNSTMFVNFEPCCHLKKKTPPCTQLIAKKGIKKVVISMKDPNPRVNGRGIKLLKRNKIKTEVGVHEVESKELNKGFVALIKKKRPFVTLKICASMDGKIYNIRDDNDDIGDYLQRRHANGLRKEFDSVLVGVNTIIRDNPQLDYRGSKKNIFQQPRPIVLDSRLRTPLTSKIVIRGNRPIIFTKISPASKKFKALVKAGCEIVTLDVLDLKKILKKLPSLGIQRVLVEGGGKVFSGFLESKLWDELIIYYSPKFLGEAGLSLTHNLRNQFLINKNNEMKIKRVGRCLMLRIK